MNALLHQVFNEIHRKGLRNLNDGSLKSFMITIDDGYESVYNIAYLILKELEMKATLFVKTSHIESGERFGVPMLTWEKLKEMNDSGYIEIGNHTHDLHWRGENNSPGKEAMVTNVTKDGKKITDAQREQMIIEDLKTAGELVERNVGVPPKSFAYPYGAYDQVAERAVKKAGYTLNHTVIEGVN